MAEVVACYCGGPRTPDFQRRPPDPEPTSIHITAHPRHIRVTQHDGRGLLQPTSSEGLSLKPTVHRFTEKVHKASRAYVSRFLLRNGQRPAID